MTAKTVNTYPIMLKKLQNISCNPTKFKNNSKPHRADTFITADKRGKCMRCEAPLVPFDDPHCT